MIVLANELNATPEVDDKIIDTNKGVTYKILSVMTDPADAHWEIQCRI